MFEFKHCSDVGMRYTQHMKFSFKLSKLFLQGSLKALIHAIYPDIYITSSTEINREIQNMLQNPPRSR